MSNGIKEVGALLSNKNPPQRVGFQMVDSTGFALHKFPDGNFARARPRGFCLSPCGLKQKHRSGLRTLPRTKQLVRYCQIKNPLFSGF